MKDQCIIKVRENNNEAFVVVYKGDSGIRAESIYAWQRCRLSMRQSGMVWMLREDEPNK